MSLIDSAYNAAARASDAEEAAKQSKADADASKQAAQSARDAAVEVAEHPPIPGEVYWELWNPETEQYEVSDIRVVHPVYPDWQENDPDSPNYVQNRTHWMGARYEDLVPETTVECYVNDQGLACVDLDTQADLIVGHVYEVVIDGVVYDDVVAQEDGDVWIGGEWDAVVYHDNPEYPFYIMNHGALEVTLISTEPMHTFTIREKIPYAHQLSREYIPSKAYEHNDATMLLEHRLVGVTGGPIDVSMSFDPGFRLVVGTEYSGELACKDYEDDPIIFHGTAVLATDESPVELVPTGAIGFQLLDEFGEPGPGALFQNSEGQMQVVGLFGGPEYLFLTLRAHESIDPRGIPDMYHSYEYDELVYENWALELEEPNVPVIVDAADVKRGFQVGDYVVMYLNGVDYSGVAVELDGLPTVKTGARQVSYNPADGTLSIQSNMAVSTQVCIGVRETRVKQIGPKYLPEIETVTSWNDLEDKPFYTGYSITELLPETTADTSAEVVGADVIEMEVGKTYTVEWNGVEYKDFNGTVSKELIRLDSLSGEYKFKPTGNPSAKYTDPQNKQREYVLDDAQKDYFKQLYREKYDELFLEVIQSGKYLKAKDADKATMLEDTRDDVLDATKEEFFDWLRKNGVRSIPKTKK